MNTREQWQLTMEAAELYERYPARYILGPWAPLLVDAARLEAGERVLDAVTDQDAKALRELSEKESTGFSLVWLNSKGGEVFSAMQIGRLLRKQEAETWVTKSGKCYSSCALIFIAGVSRINTGQVGLHRPYLASAPQSRQVLEKQIPIMLSQVKRYVAEMGVTDNFYQTMMNTEPSRMAIYELSDIEKLVPVKDPVYDEVSTSYSARLHGITTSEQRQRDKDAESCYYKLRGSQDKPMNPRILTCMGAVGWGLSERVFSDRLQKSFLVCFQTDEEMEILGAIP